MTRFMLWFCAALIVVSVAAFVGNLVAGSYKFAALSAVNIATYSLLAVTWRRMSTGEAS